MKNSIIQIFSFIVAALLFFTFYVFLIASMASGQRSWDNEILTAMILIIISIILLAIFAQVSRIEQHLVRKK